MKVVTEILQDLEILKKHKANLKIRINYYFTHFLDPYMNFKDFAYRIKILTFCILPTKKAVQPFFRKKNHLFGIPGAISTFDWII